MTTPIDWMTADPWHNRIPDGMFYADEVEEARMLEAEWSEALWVMSIAEITDWMRLHPRATMDQAVAFHEAGVTPKQANLRLWYSQINSDRPTLFDQVYTRRSITLADAVRQIHEYEQAAGHTDPNVAGL